MEHKDMMTLNDVKNKLQKMEQLRFSLPDNTVIPAHFHVTEVGVITRDFIDCGGVLRTENRINFQLWVSHDSDHRLGAAKLVSIIEKAETALKLENWEVEVEFQRDTIGKYGLAETENGFQMVNLQTACLAEDACGIPPVKPKLELKSISKSNSTNCCTPGSGCC